MTLPSSHTPTTTTTSTSKFKKLLPSTKKNPYKNPHHPNHNPSPGTPSKNFQPLPRPASPRGSFDYLAEARQAAGRDSVTGRRLDAPGPSQASAPRSRSVPAPQGRRQRDQGQGQGHGTTTTTTTTHTAYQERNHGVRQTTGTRYDLFVQEMKGRKVVGIEPPMGEYYAPERRMVEYYGNGGEPLVRVQEFYGR